MKMAGKKWTYPYRICPLANRSMNDEQKQEENIWDGENRVFKGRVFAPGDKSPTTDSKGWEKPSYWQSKLKISYVHAVLVVTAIRSEIDKAKAEGAKEAVEYVKREFKFKLGDTPFFDPEHLENVLKAANAWKA